MGFHSPNFIAVTLLFFVAGTPQGREDFAPFSDPTLEEPR